MLFAGGYRSLAVPLAARALRISPNKHLTLHASGWCCRSSHNSTVALSGETVSSTTDAGNLTATSSSNRYLPYHYLSIFSPRAHFFILILPFSSSYPKYDRLLPCPKHKSPPRIEHLVVSEGGPVLEYICKALDLPQL